MMAKKGAAYSLFTGRFTAADARSYGANVSLPSVGIACHSFRNDGGMGTYVQDLADGLLELGIRPVVFTKKIDFTRPLAKSVDFVRIDCRLVPSKLRDYWYNLRLGAERRRHPVDIMISCNRNTHTDIAVCGGTHLGFCRAMEHPLGFFDRHMVDLEKRYYQTSRLIVAHSEGMRRELLEIYGEPAEKCVTIYPPVSCKDFYPQPGRKPLDFGTGDRYTFVIPSAGNHRMKGLDILIDYFGRTTLPITLLLAGRPLKGEHRNVKYIGFRKDMPDVYRSADFTTLASRYEPFGLVAIESVACGTPAVLAENVCSSEVIDAPAKFLFDRNSFESFEAAVKAAIAAYGHRKIEDPARYLHVTQSNKEHVQAVLDAYARVTGRL
jgi:glycosyltransferase involved in cell wall biosynthesis